MKVNIFKCLTLSLLLCSIQLLYAGRIYDEFEDTYKITWIGNSKLISGTTDDWAQRAGDIYRLKIDDPSNYSFLVYELPENEIAHEVIVDYYSPTGLRPTLAVKNSAGEETKYVEGWDNGYPEITDKGHGLYRCTLKDNLIPEDATQVVIYLDAQSDIELLRNIVYYGDGYQAKNYNEKTNYYRVQKLLEKAESGNDITIGVIGGSMTAGANAEPMETNCYGGPIKGLVRIDFWNQCQFHQYRYRFYEFLFRVYPCRRETITIQPRFNYNRICLQRPTRRYLSGFLRKPDTEMLEKPG